MTTTHRLANVAAILCAVFIAGPATGSQGERLAAREGLNFSVPGAGIGGATQPARAAEQSGDKKTDWLASDPSGWVDVTPRKSLKGWTRVPIPPDKPLDPMNQWKIEKDQHYLLCEGNHGHEWLRYDHAISNFLLHVEWRFEPDPRGKGYNSGIFVRNDLMGNVWHQAQVGQTAYIFGQTLVHGEVGPKFKTPTPAVNPLHSIGEWNTYEIRCDGPKITLWVNGDLTGEYDVPEVPKGYWGLEAEGYHIEFRNVKIKKLP